MKTRRFLTAVPTARRVSSAPVKYPITRPGLFRDERGGRFVFQIVVRHDVGQPFAIVEKMGERFAMIGGELKNFAHRGAVARFVGAYLDGRHRGELNQTESAARMLDGHPRASKPTDRA